MERDLDKKLYNDYLSGEKQAFEYLYNKYKSRIEYFIYNIVRDYQRAEDLAQETFIYIMKNKMKSDISFKYYIYLIAKSKALNYISVENRRAEIIDIYLNNNKQIEKDVLEVITQEETKKEILESIELLEEKYKNAVYLTKIENLSYKEVSEILGETLQNTKNLVHRGKRQLKKILLKKGFDEMNKVSKALVIILCVSVLLTGITYAATVIYNELIKKQDQTTSRGLFDFGDGQTFYENNLMANDMTYDYKSRMYYKIISNSDDYQKYKSRVDEFPNINEINFEENFIVIIANENTRQFHEADMEVYNAFADESTTHIIMKQKENPNYENKNNIWYAVLDKSLLRDNADVTIEYKELNIRNFKKVEDLPNDYDIDDAINDGCFVLENNKNITNSTILDEFVESTNNNINSFIRIYTNYNRTNPIETRIKDVEYKDGIYYIVDYDLNNQDRTYRFSFSNKLEKKNSTFGIEYFWSPEPGVIGGTNGLILVIIQ